MTLGLKSKVQSPFDYSVAKQHIYELPAQYLFHE